MPEFLRTKLALVTAIAVAAAVTGALVVASNDTKQASAKKKLFEITPPSLSLDALTDGPVVSAKLTLHNTTADPLPASLSSGAPWVSFGADANVTVPAGGDHEVEVFADPLGVKARQETTVVVRSGVESQEIPVSLVPGGRATRARGLTLTPDALTFDGTTTAEVVLGNAAKSPLSWRAASTESWLTVTPEAGTIKAGAHSRLAVAIDPSDLSVGTHTASLSVAAGSARAATAVTVNVTSQPLLLLPKTLLDFGRHQKGQTVRSFEVRNAGKEPLTYDVANDRFYVYLQDDASGTVQPGKAATVTVTFDHNKSLYGERDFPLQVRTNGGSGEVRVFGITDTVGPKLRHEDIATTFEDSRGRTHRWARGELRDEFGTVAGARVQYRVCSGNPPAPPACQPWTLSEMARFKGAIWQADVGPLPDCTGATGVYVNWRVQAEDDLVNHQFNPGSSTFYAYQHCAPPG